MYIVRNSNNTIVIRCIRSSRLVMITLNNNNQPNIQTVSSPTTDKSPVREASELEIQNGVYSKCDTTAPFLFFFPFFGPAEICIR
jgi:hypothetical protein